MNQAIQLANRLHRVGLFVETCVEIDYGFQIRLECGAIINLYSTGKVVVQGKLDARGKTQRVSLLHQLLPANTSFPPSMNTTISPKRLGSAAPQDKTHFVLSNAIDVPAFEIAETSMKGTNC
jgi:hypothetical protein